MLLLTILVFTALNLLFAKHDYKKIAAYNKTTYTIPKLIIKHGLNAAVYISMLVVPYFVLHHNYWLMAALLFNRLLVFNIALSLDRGNKWDYVPKKPTAITDRVAFRVFGFNGKLMYFVYSVIFIILTIITLIYAR